MKITVLKCDRCKQEVEGLIEFSFINLNVEPERTVASKGGIFGNFFGSIGNGSSKYPTIKGGLCFNCMEELLRWLGHPENYLNSRIKGVKI